MPANTGPANGQNTSKDASENALKREQAAAPDGGPVKQHNPGEQGLNPDQRGPAQPSGNDSSNPRKSSSVT